METDNLLIFGAVAVGAYLIYQKAATPVLPSSAVGTTTVNTPSVSPSGTTPSTNPITQLLSDISTLFTPAPSPIPVTAVPVAPATGAVVPTSGNAGGSTVVTPTPPASGGTITVALPGATPLQSGASPAIMANRVAYLKSTGGLDQSMAMQQAAAEMGDTVYMCGYTPPGWTGRCV